MIEETPKMAESGPSIDCATDTKAESASQAVHAELRLAECRRCGHHSFPATIYSCRHCGAEDAALQAVTPPDALRLLNFVTVHAELTPGLPVPCVIGEVQLAPGLVEEALIDVASEEALQPGMTLLPRAIDNGAAISWRFVPTGSAS
jgi:uncharacterized OB-fold protein